MLGVGRLVGIPKGKSPVCANLQLSLRRCRLKGKWSFSGLATTTRHVLIYYLDMEKFFNQPDVDLNEILEEIAESPPKNE